MQTCIVVLGMHRSGVSTFGGLVERLGINMGANEQVIALNEVILEESGIRWDRMSENQGMDPDQKEAYIEQAKEILLAECAEMQTFAIADPANCVLFDIWAEALKALEIETKILLPYRHSLEVAASLHEQEEFSLEKGIRLWMEYFLAQENTTRNYPRLYLSYENLLQKTAATSTKLRSFLKIKYNKKEQLANNAYINKSLQHHHYASLHEQAKYPDFVMTSMDLVEQKDFNLVNAQEFENLAESFASASRLFSAHDENSSAELEALRSELATLQERDIAHVQSMAALQETTVSQSLQIEALDADLESVIADLVELGEEKIDAHEKATAQIAALDNEVESVLADFVALKEQKIDNEMQAAEVIKSLHEQQTVLQTQNETLSHDRVSEVDALNTEIEQILQDMAIVKQERENLSIQSAKEIKSLHEQQTVLQTQNETLSHERASEVDMLNTQINEILQDMAIVKEEREKFKEQTQEEITQLNTLNTELKLQTTQSAKEIKSLHEQQAELRAQKDSQLAELHEQYTALQAQNNTLTQEKATLNQEHERRVAEVHELNTQIDQIIQDLATIKESKCWIYTKPIRDLQKIFKES